MGSLSGVKYVGFDWIVGRDGTRHGRVGAFDGRDGDASRSRRRVRRSRRRRDMVERCLGDVFLPVAHLSSASSPATPAVSKRVLVQYIVGDDPSDPGWGLTDPQVSCSAEAGV